MFSVPAVQKELIMDYGNGEIVWAKYATDIFWPAKVVEEEDGDDKRKLIYFFDEDCWEPITSKLRIHCWDCQKQNSYVSKGENLENISRRLSFNRALTTALQQYKDLNGKKAKKKKRKSSTDKKTSTRKKSNFADNDGNNDVKRNEKLQSNLQKPKARNSLTGVLEAVGDPCLAGFDGDSSPERPLINEIDSLEEMPNLTIANNGEENNSDSSSNETPFYKTNCSDDDDEDLPEAFSPVRKTSSTFKQGDLLWAKFQKFPYWPALFHSLSKPRGYKSRPKVLKAWVWFFDETWLMANIKRQILPVPVENIIPYCCDPFLRDKFLKDGQEFKSKYNFENCIKYAEEYAKNKASGKLINFFEYQEEALEDDEIEEYTSKECRIPSCTKDKVASHTATRFEDLLSNTRSKRISTSVQKHKNLLEAFDKTRPTLNKIFKEEIECSRHETFLRGTTHQKNALKYKSGFGYIDDDEITEQIIQKLFRWFEEDNTQSNINAFTYVVEVWLPEAMILALMDAHNIDRKAAENMYHDCT